MSLLKKPITGGLILIFTLLFDLAIREQVELNVLLYPQHTFLLRLSYLSIPLLMTIILIIYENKK